MLQPPVCVDDDLTISITRGTTRLSPGEALSVAEKLIRTSTRRMSSKSRRTSREKRGGIADARAQF